MKHVPLGRTVAVVLGAWGRAQVAQEAEPTCDEYLRTAKVLMSQGLLIRAAFI